MWMKIKPEPKVSLGIIYTFSFSFWVLELCTVKIQGGRAHTLVWFRLLGFSVFSFYHAWLIWWTG